MTAQVNLTEYVTHLIKLMYLAFQPLTFCHGLRVVF